MDQKALRAKITELREAAEQARALSVDLSDPEAERGFVELARKMDAEADALERSAAAKEKKGSGQAAKGG